MKHGVAFGDFIHFEKPGKIRHHYHDNSFERVRVYFLLGVLILGMSFIISRLVYLQVFHGSYYRLISDNNRIKTVITHAPQAHTRMMKIMPLIQSVILAKASARRFSLKARIQTAPSPPLDSSLRLPSLTCPLAFAEALAQAGRTRLWQAGALAQAGGVYPESTKGSG